MRKTKFMKQRALKWTLLEIFFPLYPICFLWLIFKYGADFLPYEKIETEAVSLMPAVGMLNTSLPGLAYMMSKGGKIGFAPVAPAADGAARVIQNTVCAFTAQIYPHVPDMCMGDHPDTMEQCMAEFAAGGGVKSACEEDCRFSTGTGGAAMPPELCKLYTSPEVMNVNEGWMPSFEDVESVNADHIAADEEEQGMYLGVEVDAKGLTFRHEEMILVADMSGDPMEKNAGAVGLHAIQALSSYALISYNICPAAFDDCEGDCLMASMALSESMESLMPSCSPALAAAAGGTFDAAACVTALTPGCEGVAEGAADAAACATQLQAVASCQMDVFITEPEKAAALIMASGMNMYMEEFPVLATIKLVNFRKFMYPMLFLTVLFINIQATLTQLGQEKERGIKNALSLKGMRKEAFWMTWFFGEGMVLSVSTVIVTVGAKLVGVIEHTSMLHFYASIWIYGISLILMAFVLSSFFTEAKTMFIAAAVMLIVFSVIAYVVELLFIRQDILGLPYVANLCLFLFSPIPFGHLMWTLSSGELMGKGWEEGLTRLEWNIADDYYYEAYIFIVLDCFLYIGLTLVLDSYFSDPLSFGRAPKTTDGTAPTPNMGISIKSLSKLFTWSEKAEGWGGACGKKTKNEVQAVDGLDLDVEKNQICCLLGHNGAGKTTTMLLLAGLEAPDSGAATVAGYNIVEDRELMRQNLGMCPQHDILYDELTNMEHLQLYGSMQGLSDAEANSEADRLLAAVGLTSKSGDLACQMSGGQRRRLSLAVSLIGCPAAAFLDEPTTGMDPHNRQLCWKLLQREKKTCTILLTTHSMEEADLLGDVLAVMDKGKLQVSGTAMELKNKYGSGYGLTCVKTDKDIASDPIISLVMDKINGASVRTDIGTELSFALPMDESKSFVGLFRAMESDSSLGLATFGLTQTSLEEVFLNLAEMNDHSAEATGNNATADQKEDKEPFPEFACEPTFGGQLSAVLYQVSLQSLRYPIAVVYLVIMPAVFTYIATLVVPYMKNDPPVSVDMLSVVTDAKFSDEIARDPCGEHMWAGSMPFSGANSAIGPADIGYPTCNQLVAELELETHDLTQHPYYATCYNTNGTAGQGLNDWGFPAGGLSLLYNGTETYSSRAALACAYKQISKAAGIEGGITTSYKSYVQKVGSNALGGGAMMAFVANIFMILSGYYCEEQIRLRVERVKEMMLLCGLPRLTYWVAYFLSHYLFFFISWNLSYIIMWTSGGMDGINDNSAFCYYLLAMLAGPAFIVYGYLLSFVTDDILAAQQWVNEYLNLTFGLPFMILTFAVQDEDTRSQLENIFGILPGFAFYKGIGVLETAATNGEPFTAADTFDWDKGLAKYMCFLLFDIFFFCFLLFVIDTNVIGRMMGPKLADAATPGMDDDQKILLDKIPPVEGATLDSKPNNAAHADKLSKKYPLEGGGSVQAVRETSIGVPKNEVLGL